MTIKLLLLKSGEDIIADISEMVAGEGERKRVVGYFLNRPCVIKMRDPNLINPDSEDSAQKAGFSVERCEYTSKLSKEDIVKFCLPKKEIIPICRK